jgi:hypothetical protein
MAQVHAPFEHSTRPRFIGGTPKSNFIPFYAIGSDLFDFHQIRFSFGETTEEAGRK